MTCGYLQLMTAQPWPSQQRSTAALGPRNHLASKWRTLCCLQLQNMGVRLCCQQLLLRRAQLLGSELQKLQRSRPLCSQRQPSRGRCLHHPQQARRVHLLHCLPPQHQQRQATTAVHHRQQHQGQQHSMKVLCLGQRWHP